MKKGVCKKFEGLTIVSILVIIGFLFFLSAYTAGVAGIDVAVSNGTGSSFDWSFNATEDVYYFFNFTVNNTVGVDTAGDSYNITEVNVTLPSSFLVNGSYNNSNANGTTGAFHNYTLVSGAHVLQWRNTSTSILDVPGYLINGSNTSAWFVFNATASTPGQYTINITVLHANVSGVDANAYNITTIQLNMTVNDTTAPDILVANFLPLAEFNKSGVFVLNGSISDNYKTGTGSQIIDSVNVSIINPAGTVNATYWASNMTGNYWNVSINTSQFPDGVYNITIMVNDTYRTVGTNNVNSTNITNIRFDNTAPTVGFSCTPTTVNAGNVVTCACSGTDATAGVNSTTGYTATPSTSNTGSYTQTCSVIDTAGNSATGSATYVVVLSSSGTSGSSSGATSTFTYSKSIPQNAKEFSEIKSLQYELKAKERVKIMINSEQHHIGVKAVSETKATIEIASNPVEVELAVGEDAKIDVNADNYYDIYVKLNSIISGKADITIEYLNEVIPEGGSAVSTSGEDVTSVTTGEEPGTTTGKETTSLTLLWWVLGIIVIAIIVWFVLQKKK